MRKIKKIIQTLDKTDGESEEDEKDDIKKSQINKILNAVEQK